jgi:maltooligosyltrehalose trehalohydrolase
MTANIKKPKSGRLTAKVARRFPIGVEVVSGEVHARVWAPKAQRVEVALAADDEASLRSTYVDLQPEGNGYYSGLLEGAAAGQLYGFRLDGGDRLWADPASRFQPRGPEGVSEIIDASDFAWSDESWQGCQDSGQVIYEIHVGAFTQAGDWESAARELPELTRIGITMIELMPVADFSGEFGWGYDGVCMFAPTRLYGRPDDFRRFVDRAHSLGLGVILDVVYNHFGNIGNYVTQFSDDYVTDRYDNEWGGAINFDGGNAEPVREFFTSNVRYWIEEFHLDGFRFDATQAIHDASADHILTNLTRTAREAAGKRSVFLVVENEPQDVRNLRSPAEGGFGMNACWNDDFHHAAMVRLTGQNRAYFSDYLGSSQEFIAALKRGFIYQGQVSRWQGKPRGTPTNGLPAKAFVTFLQNHDQVANSGRGERVHTLTSPGRYRAMAALWLLSPQTPLFFQGQEFAASTPFLYFADYKGDIAQSVSQGRAKFLSQFPALATPEMQRLLSDPADVKTFRRSKLNFDERQQHAQTYALHTDLLKLRREDPVFRLQRADRLDAAVLNADCFVVRYFGDQGNDRLLLVNWGRDLLLSPVPEPLMAPPAERSWSMLWSSESHAYGGGGTGPLKIEKGWSIPGEAAVVLEAVIPPAAKKAHGGKP